jgi:ribonucleoside-diphosphate reductase alpha chain
MLSNTGDKIFKMKYAQGNESWEDACLRVATHVASAETAWGATEEAITNLIKEYFTVIYNLAFIPGGRIIANAGTGIKNLNNCYVLPIYDSRAGIYQTLKDAAEIFANGGGVGYNFSNIREEGAPITTTGGQASGPLSFMTLFDQTGEVIQQASRRGAQMAMLNVDHPDIKKFIDFKSTPNTRNARLLNEYDRNLRTVNGTLKGSKYYNVLEKTLLDDQLTHFNMSVVLTDEFMIAVKNDDDDFQLKSPTDGHTVKVVKARELLHTMAEHAWASGDPGVFFKDRANEDNMVKYIGNLEASNPCGEVPLLPYEACCLGSINLAKFYLPEGNGIDLENLEKTVRLGIRFLDDVQEVSSTSLDEVNYFCKGLRRLGLGVLGWADLLAMLEIPFDSKQAYRLGEYLSWFISFFSWLESVELAEKRGVFPLWNAELVDRTVLKKVFSGGYISEDNKFDVDTMRVRNVSVTAIAPTGSIALIAGANSSIEPFFALAYRRNITQGVGNTATDTITEINPILFDKLKKYQVSDSDIEKVKKHVLKYGTLGDCDLVPDMLKEVFKTSQEISWQDHVLAQAAWQNYVSNAVSKTINMPETATVADIEQAFEFMWENNLKGGTVYRNNSKGFQILNAGKS